ncbi:glycosyltransferase [Candidatus Dependentiae bacterium]|nr:glycosyltransferase [Candidatus Dependentiae bacterium]
MDLSIIIINYNVEILLNKCVESIYKNTSGIDFEVIVIDNNSPNDHTFLAENQRITFIQNNENKGFSFAVNQGIALSKGKYLMVLNPDSLILNDALKKMVNFLNDHSRIGIIGPKVYEKDKKTIQLSCRSFPDYSIFLFNRYSVLSKLFPNNKWTRRYLLHDWAHDHIREVDWVSGCCMMIRKKMIEKIGAFDVQFFMYNEDVDICIRAKQNGWGVYYYPDAEILHYIGESSKFLKYQMIIERHKSIWKFYKKHYHTNFILDGMTFLGLLLRGIIHILFS